MTVSVDPAFFAAAGVDAVPLFDVLVSDLRKELKPGMGSNQGRELGRRAHPINFSNASQMMLAVNIHETCIRTKRDATVGLGFETEDEKQSRLRERELSDRSHTLAMESFGKKNPKDKKDPKEKPKVPKEKPEKAVKEAAEADRPRSKAEEVLDPLCGDHGFQSLLNQVGEDYENTGNAYIEVVREGDEIVALWHMPAAAVYVINEVTKPFQHFEVDQVGGTLRYANFGDVEDFTARNPSIVQEQITELIHFKQPTSLDPDYGLPSWLSATPWLELAQKVMQVDFDYFNNRAVPDLMILLTGAKVPEDDINNLKKQIEETVGAGKRYRSILANIPNPETKATIERLNSDNREKFSDMWATIQLQAVSTHRVPPLLAGVVLPGKIGAANELPNALVAFQTLYVQQHQRNFEARLRNTIGSEGGVGGLGEQDFFLRKITDYYDMGQLETMSRMRETATEASMRGRDLEEGLEE